jgi:hypothetical protein
MLTLLTFATVIPIAFVKGDDSGVELMAFTSNPPTIDGIMSAGEWDDADTIDFVSPHTGGAPAPISHTLYVMNDLDNLYLAIKRYDYYTSGSADWITFIFDNDDDGLLEIGDDVLKLQHTSSTPAQGEFLDMFNLGSYPTEDENYGGTVDGEGAMGTDGTIRIFELSHPLNSGDYGYLNAEETETGPHDFSLAPGDTVGFNIVSYDDSHDLGDWPVDMSSWSADVVSGFGDITIAGPPTIESAIFLDSTTWTTTDTFGVGNEVCVVGAGFSPETSYDVQVVNDVDWTDGMTIPAYVAKTSVTTDAFGEILDAYPVWDGATPGKYDIIVDVNNNGIYDEGIDALDDSDIQVTAGFFVIPEVAIGSIMAAAAMFAALGLFAYKKKRAPKNSRS